MKIADEINAVGRSVETGQTEGGEGHSVLLRRTYDATIEDVWDACTNAARISRWFLPDNGDLRLGGTYQLEGNAGGRILHCEPPRRFRVTWIFGEGTPASEVEVRLSSTPAGGTRLELEHTALVDAALWEQFGPGAVGVGWDGALLGLTLHLRGESVGDRDAWQQSAEAREFVGLSSTAWGAAFAASGATPDAVAGAVQRTTAFYSPDRSPAQDAHS
jgi:uncharacterized protein YndB with AHSA1/START domain